MKLGRLSEAREQFELALSRTRNRREQELLRSRLEHTKPGERGEAVR